MKYFAVLRQDTTVEWDSGKRETLKKEEGIIGTMEDGFFCFEAKNGPARLPIKCFRKIQRWFQE